MSINWEQAGTAAGGLVVAIIGAVAGYRKGVGSTPGERMARIEGDLAGLRQQVADLQHRMTQLDNRLVQMLGVMQRNAWRQD